MKKSVVKELLAATISQIKNTQKWNQELRDAGRANQINEMKLHYMDGRREAFEELLREPKAKKKGKK